MLREQIIGSLKHMLLFCNGLKGARESVINLWMKELAQMPSILTIFQKYTSSYFLSTDSDTTIMFILDPSMIPEIIILKQAKRDQVLMKVYCHTLHKSKLNILGVT